MNRMCMNYLRFLEHTEYRTWNFRVQVNSESWDSEVHSQRGGDRDRGDGSQEEGVFIPDDGKPLPAEEVDFVFIGAGAVC